MTRRPSTPGARPMNRQPAAKKSNWLTSTALAVLGAVFILGIAVGVAFSKTTNFTPENVASIEFIDRNAPKRSGVPVLWCQRHSDGHSRLCHLSAL